jgi:hypothetical protein
VILAALSLVACVGPAWDLEALERRHPELARVPGHRLQDVTPYLLPRHDRLELFLCRWEAGPLRTSLPPDATARERELLERALASWEALGLGVRFEPTADASAADIRISIGEEDRAAGEASADCGVVEREAGLAARLVRARVQLQRWSYDTLGRKSPKSDAEWLGTALHELGHALGFQGHTRHGSGIMARETHHVRRHGKRVLEGDELRAPSVRALYRIPSGARLARLPLAAGRTAAIDRLAELAPSKGYRGPIVRVGDEAARIVWWKADGRSVGVSVPALHEALRDPARLGLVPDLVAQAWLGPQHPD